jgi:hypothetical protein
MSNINFPNDPYHKYKIEKVESESKEKEKHKVISENNKTKLAVFHAIWKNILKVFDNAKKKAVFKDPIFNDIEGLKKLFVLLGEENVSENLDFLNKLAFKWLEFIDSYNLLSVERKESFKELKKFVDEVYGYPEDAAYSLGYYLTEHAGYNWIPSPFMEILLLLHNEHKKDKEKSTLSKWIKTLDDITVRSFSS